MWIEIRMEAEKNKSASVTPLAGVWIEIAEIVVYVAANCGHSPCGSVE